MSRSVHPRVLDNLAERYLGQMQEMARQCIEAGISEDKLKEMCKFAEFSRATPVQIVDWFKRRTVRDKDWRVMGPRFVDFLLADVRPFAQSQEPDEFTRQGQIIAAFLDGVKNCAGAMRSY